MHQQHGEQQKNWVPPEGTEGRTENPRAAEELLVSAV